MTDEIVMIRLFHITWVNSGALSAEVKLSKVGCSGRNLGVNVSTSFGGLNAVLIIQYAGNAMMMAKTTPTVLATQVPMRRGGPPTATGTTGGLGSAAARREGRRRSTVTISPCLPT